MRLNFVRRARDLGFTLDEIRALLELAEKRDRPCAEARDVAASHLSDVSAKIAGLRTMERVLEDMVARCTGGTAPDCPLIEALFEPNDVVDGRIPRQDQPRSKPASKLSRSRR